MDKLASWRWLAPSIESALLAINVPFAAEGSLLNLGAAVFIGGQFIVTLAMALTWPGD